MISVIDLQNMILHDIGGISGLHCPSIIRAHMDSPDVTYDGSPEISVTDATVTYFESSSDWDPFPIPQSVVLMDLNKEFYAILDDDTGVTGWGTDSEITFQITFVRG